MSTTMAGTTAGTTGGGRAAGDGPEPERRSAGGFAGAVASEWTKLWPVRAASAGALSVLVALLWALPSVLLGLGGDTLAAVNDRLPYGAGDHFMRVGGDSPYSSATAVLIVAAWTAAAHAIGLYVLRRRDA
ncbi:hypothetical protein ACFY0N_14660 [Streptomyces vinaceus]|uniref:hypothetical protein n=1 Tax=Streptomyces vinaceus TaxID=1960 RepID=UPI00369A0028